MSNKKAGKLDFRNVKKTQFDASQTQKMEFSELQSAKRVFDTNTILKDGYTNFSQTLDGQNRPTSVTYYQASDYTIDRLNFVADVSGSLAGTYYVITSPLSEKTIALYQVVDGSGVAPNVADEEYPVAISENDTAGVVAFSNKQVLNSIQEFTLLFSPMAANYLEFQYNEFGEAVPINLGTTGFTTSRSKTGDAFEVGSVELEYDNDGNIVWQGQVLKGAVFNPYKAEFNFPVKSSLTDENGNPFSPTNPLHVQLSDGSVNIGTVNAELEVQLDHTGANPDSVQIGDGVETLAINSDQEALVHDQETHSLLQNIDCRVDEANSTSTPLNNGEVFYGPWTERTGPDIIVAPYADQDFTWYVQFANTELSSTLGVPVYTAGTSAGIDSSLRYDYVAGETLGTPRRLIVGRQWYRVVAVNNSGSNMTAFRLQTSLGDYDKLEYRLNSDIPLDADSILTRSVNIGLDPNNVYVNDRQRGYVDGLSTTTPLLSGQTFTSDIVRCDGYTQISTELKADQTGILNGTWYQDAAGTVPLRTFTVPYTPAENINWLSSVVFSEYFQFEFTNTGPDQTQFHLKVILDTQSKHGQLLELESFVPPNSLVNVNRVVLAGKTPSGIYNNINTNDAGALQVSDFRFDVALGNVPNYSIESKYGQNPDIDTGTEPEDIWSNGGNYTGQPIGGSAETITITSSSNNDTSAGTGARTVKLYGLDGNFDLQEETVTLNGTAGVTTVNTWRRMYLMEVLTAGSTGANQGTITARHTTTTSNIFATIQSGINQSAVSAITVPSGYTMYIVKAAIEIARANGSAGSATVSIRTRKEGEVYRAIRYKTITTNFSYDNRYEGAIILEEKTDFKFRVEQVSDNNTEASAEFEYILVQN